MQDPTRTAPSSSLRQQSKCYMVEPSNVPSPTFSSLCRTDWLDAKHVVFGHVISGADVVRKMEKCGTKGGSPTQKISIVACGELK